MTWFAAGVQHVQAGVLRVRAEVPLPAHAAAGAAAGPGGL